MSYLLDGNVLVALADQAHVHHPAANRWFAANADHFATCPITQGTLVRMMLRHGAVETASQAAAILQQICAHPRHRFYADQVSYVELSWRGVIGHRQVTDAYLVALAASHGARLATFDKGLVAVHGAQAELLTV